MKMQFSLGIPFFRGTMKGVMFHNSLILVFLIVNYTTQV